MKDKSEKEKCSVFLYTIGQAGRDVYNTMTLADGERDKIDILFAKFEAYCKPKQNVMIERYRFNTRVQAKEETIDQYLTKLKLIAKNCSFGELENQLIRDKIVCDTHLEEVRQQLLLVEDLSLDKAISICRADEESKKSAQYLTDSAEVCDLEKHTGRSHKGFTKPQTDSKKPLGEFAQPSTKHFCNKCGLQHAKKQCPAYGKQC